MIAVATEEAIYQRADIYVCRPIGWLALECFRMLDDRDMKMMISEIKNSKRLVFTVCDRERWANREFATFPVTLWLTNSQ